jgi:hypothetical protein
MEGTHASLKSCIEGLLAGGMEGTVLRVLRWREGWTVSHAGTRQSRVEAAQVVEFLTPLGPVVGGMDVVAGAGPFARPVMACEYILFAQAGALLPNMSKRERSGGGEPKCYGK